MIRYLTLDEVKELHRRGIELHGGTHGIRELGALESSVAQPQTTFGGQDLYPGVAEKAAILGFLLATNHSFIDGNKRVGQAAMETFLVLNGIEIDASVDEQFAIFSAVAGDKMDRAEFGQWVKSTVVPLRS